MFDDLSSLAQALIGLGYVALFKAANHKRQQDEIRKNSPQYLIEQLVDDPGSPPLARFLASQMLLEIDMTFLSRTDLGSLSHVYIEALLHNFTTTMSDWGFLHSNDDMGSVGSMFLVFGERSMPELLNLLNDDRLVDYERPAPDFSGFDPTRLQKIRIKDFAALYVSKVRNLPLHLTVRFDERDTEITELKKQVAQRQPDA